MGCASSSPLANVGGAAKQAANDVVHAGEGALHGIVKITFIYFIY